MNNFSHSPDPRVGIILNRLAALLDSSGSDRDGGSPPVHYISLPLVATSILEALDTWIIGLTDQIVAQGLPKPRLYGFKICDCTKVLNELLIGTTETSNSSAEKFPNVAIWTNGETSRIIEPEDKKE